MKKGLLILLIFVLTVPLIAQNGQEKEKDDGVHVIPILSYNLLSLDKRTVHVPGAGVAVMAGEMEPEAMPLRPRSATEMSIHMILVTVSILMFSWLTCFNYGNYCYD